MLAQRRAAAAERLAELGRRLEDAKRYAGDKGCVYLTGSFARGEASPHSDLDLFIVGQTDGLGRRLLSNLDEICLKAELIKACKQTKFPEFSGDGEWLEHYTVKNLVDALGRPEDDASNTFTARMLLLLESRPLIGDAIHGAALDEVIAKYWADYADHADDFVPSFLANDILRMWRTFCINYEARTQRDPPQKKAKRKLKNYKLKHSRLLTCYSGLAYLLAVHRTRGTVAPSDVKAMACLTPTERLERLPVPTDVEAGPHVEPLIRQYERFLEQTNQPEADLIALFLDEGKSAALRADANEFGNSMFKLLTAIGDGSVLYRMLVV
ncbi:nucleotidyltransferase domain-containing protein [Paraliomyxa miuraensis]|uniref:nucleotidyltransferase domain-containing protein n=1 Tax=Paraliomyxa miuraensis TaxID=376150 RepID=UPI002254F72C|nr:nucleotidyltransferase domain-containing protein [Paraliomyxa miuraensis]MCX4239313.1 nucleotidyltransferase domain-containing protein [Paraliomyxa miuraensis]